MDQRSRYPSMSPLQNPLSTTLDPTTFPLPNLAQDLSRLEVTNVNFKNKRERESCKFFLPYPFRTLFVIRLESSMYRTVLERRKKKNTGVKNKIKLNILYLRNIIFKQCTHLIHYDSELQGTYGSGSDIRIMGGGRKLLSNTYHSSQRRPFVIEIGKNRVSKQRIGLNLLSVKVSILPGGTCF